MTKSLSVSLIVIGDEILYGRTTDLNGAWLSKFLFRNGLKLTSMRFVKDAELDIKNALTSAFFESDIVITSGGVGPTIDDKTKAIVAEYFGKKIVKNESIIPLINKNYERFGRVWDEKLNYYHHFPEDFIAINNPKGLAPGILYFDKKNQKLLVCGPGVPREFQFMNQEEFLPKFKEYFSERFKENFQVHIRTFGVPEEKIFGELCPTLWSELEKFGSVSSLPHTIGIDIVISFTGDKALFEKNKVEITKIIESGPLKDHVWQYGNKSVTDLVFEKCIDKKIKIGFAESCTGGLASSKITDLSGSSEFFYGSIISYDNSVKKNVLKVSEETLKNFGAVSEECAREMAIGAKKALGVDFAVSITGIAGPSGGTPNKPVGTVCIGVINSKNEVLTSTHQFPGDRVRLKDRFSDFALLKFLKSASKD